MAYSNIIDYMQLPTCPEPPAEETGQSHSLSQARLLLSLYQEDSFKMLKSLACNDSIIYTLLSVN